MKLPFRSAASFLLLVSVGVNGWPYHGIVGVGQSVYVAPVYEVPPAVSLLPTEPVKEVQTVVAGPVTGTTFVEGSSSGPVTILSPATPSKLPQPSTVTTLKADVLVEAEDSVLVKGASTGPVTLVAPSANSVAIVDNATSAKTKEGAVAASASAEATVSIENAEESAGNVTRISETEGIASAKAVIGPSTGPVIIAGPTAPPLPFVTSATTTTEPATIATANATSSASAASSAVANASVSATVTVQRADDGSDNLTDATESTRIEGSASSSSSATSGSSAASVSAKVNLITPTIAVAGAPLSNVVVSAVAAPSALVSGPSGTISAGSAASLLLKPPLYTL